jgi:hypothetical protein
MRALLAATAILLVAVPAVAQPKKLHVTNTANESRVAASVSPSTTGWTFDVVKITHQPGWSTIKRAPYGVFASKDECEMARAKQVADLDDSDLRQFKPLQKEDSPAVGNRGELTADPPVSPPPSALMVPGSKYNRFTVQPPLTEREFEFMNATVCRDAAIRQTAQQD